MKPCPFCGGTSIYQDGPLTIDDDSIFFHVCKDCGCEGPYGTDPDKSAELWNARCTA